SGRHYHGPEAGLGRARSPRNSLDNHANGYRSTYYHRGQGRGAGEELGCLLPDGGETCLLGVLRGRICYVPVRLQRLEISFAL
ncbi:hypothetical protein A2U01_0086932, partial [Trifolium medium]|nr:hypothetical protein [Trifolium medium]